MSYKNCFCSGRKVLLLTSFLLREMLRCLIKSLMCESSQNLWVHSEIDVGIAESFLIQMYWLCSVLRLALVLSACMEVSMASAGISIITNTLQMQFEWWSSSKFTPPCLLAGVQSGNSPSRSPFACRFQCLTALAILCAVAAVAYGFAVYGYPPWAHTLTHQNILKGMLCTTGMYICCVLYVRFWIKSLAYIMYILYTE